MNHQLKMLIFLGTSITLFIIFINGINFSIHVENLDIEYDRDSFDFEQIGSLLAAIGGLITGILGLISFIKACNNKD